MCAKCKNIIPEETIEADCLITCADCSTIITEGDETYSNSNDEIICESCRDNYSMCECCENIVNADQTYFVERESKIVCDSCLSDNYFQCNDCSEYHPNNDSLETSQGDSICQSCYSDNYFCCDNCNEVMSNDCYASDGECESCHEDNEDNVDGLYSYSYKPNPIFQSTIKDKRSKTIKGENIEQYSTNKKLNYLGIELEHSIGIDSKADIIDHVYDIVKNVYYKEDGSLDDGIELVTHPIEFNSINWTNWAQVLKYLRSRSCRSYDTSYSCGLHIHISKQSFGNYGFLKSQYLSAKIENLLLKISKRTKSHWRQWCPSSNTHYSDLNDFKKEVIKRRLEKREQVANSPRGAFNNTSATIELRMFRGTLNLDGFRSCIEFAKDISFILSQVSLTYLINHTEAEIEAYVLNNLRPITRQLLLKTNRIGGQLELFKDIKKNDQVGNIIPDNETATI